MAKTKKKTAKRSPDVLVLRMSARLGRMTPAMRDAYVSRAKAIAGSKHPTRNAAAAVQAAGA